MPNLSDIQDRVSTHQRAVHARAEKILGTSYDADTYVAAWAQAERELGPEPEAVRASYLAEEPHPADIEGRHGESVYLHERAKQILTNEGKAMTEESYLEAVERARADLENLRRVTGEGGAAASRELVAAAVRLGIRLGEDGWEL